MITQLNYRKAVCFTLVTILLFSITPANATQAQEKLPSIEDYYFHSSWGGEGKQLLKPRDVALSPNGNIYIVNNEYNRITIVDNEGYIYKEIGGFGQADGEFDSPQSIAVNDAGEIFVSDTFNRRIQKFDSAGNHLLTFGIFGEGFGEIFAPHGLAFDSNGYLLVADGNNKIIKFSQNGAFISEWGKDYASPQPEDLHNPSDVAVDSMGNIYVADNYNYRIQIYNSSESLINTINMIDGEIQVSPEGVAVDGSGKLYVTGNDKVYIYNTIDQAFDLVDTWGGSGTELGCLGEPTGIFVDPNSGDIFISEWSNNRVTVFTNLGAVKTAFGTPDLVDGYFYFPQDITIFSNRVYISDSLNDRIQVFNLDGTFVNKWGESGSSNGQFNNPLGLDTDSEGNVYIADSNNIRIQKFDSSGAWLGSFDLSPMYPPECTSGDLVCTPNGLAIDQNDNLFITVTSMQGAHGIFNLSKDGILKDHWEVNGSSIALDTAGNVYTTWGGYIYKYSNTGELLDTLGEGPGPYKGYRGLAIDANGDIFTMTTWMGNLQKFSSDGTLLGIFGERGNDEGEFAYGSELALTEDGKLYIADVENQRVQIIAPTLPDPDPDSGLILNGRFTGPGEIMENSNQDELINRGNLFSASQLNQKSIPELEHWVYGGLLPVGRSSSEVNEGSYSMILGNERITANPQGISEAWAYQVFYVRPEWIKPVLSFNYNVYTNDSGSRSNFIAEIQDGVGLNNLEVVVLEGFEGSLPGEVPPAGTDLGWKSAEFDLSPYRGKFVRLVFRNRNLYPGSLGIWSYVENVEVRDKTSNIYLPLLLQ
jgi:sugar lactone lactonase YvrE